MGFFKRDRPVSTVEPVAPAPVHTSPTSPVVNGTSTAATTTTAAEAQPVIVKEKKGLFGKKSVSKRNSKYGTDSTSAVVAPVSPTRTSRDRGARDVTPASPTNPIGAGTNLHTA